MRIFKLFLDDASCVLTVDRDDSLDRRMVSSRCYYTLWMSFYWFAVLGTNLWWTRYNTRWTLYRENPKSSGQNQRLLQWNNGWVACLNSLGMHILHSWWTAFAAALWKNSRQLFSCPVWAGHKGWTLTMNWNVVLPWLTRDRALMRYIWKLYIKVVCVWFQKAGCLLTE